MDDAAHAGRQCFGVRFLPAVCGGAFFWLVFRMVQELGETQLNRVNPVHFLLDQLLFHFTGMLLWWGRITGFFGRGQVSHIAFLDTCFWR